MARARPAVLLVFLVVVLALIGGSELYKGGFFISKHEGDTLHFADIILRMAAGERIHQDFMTPLGVLSALPFVWLVRAGYPLGTAMVGGQLMVAVVLLPAIWWVVRRLPRLAAYLTGLYLVVLLVGLIYGEAEPAISMSMSYNRWAWALAYLALLPAFLPSQTREGQAIDGALIGLATGALVLLKITYFMALAVPILVAMIGLRSWRSLGFAAVFGLAVALVATLIGGFGYWQGYVGDLVAVAHSPLRTWPGVPPGNITGGPTFLGMNLLLLISVALMRQAGARHQGLALLTLLPAFIYIVVQNFGNDPQWLILLVALLIALEPPAGVVNGWGWDLRGAFRMAAAAALAFGLPSFLNITYSAWRHLWLDAAEYVPIVPDNPAFADLGLQKLRFARVNGNVALDTAGSGLEYYRQFADREKIETKVNGETLPECELGGGLEAWYAAMADDLEAAGYAGRRIWQADLFNMLWLFGDFPRLKGVAPWYYGGTPGLDDADLVLVPNCPIAANMRKEAVDSIAKQGIGLKELHRSPLYRLYEKVPGGAAASDETTAAAGG